MWRGFSRLKLSIPLPVLLLLIVISIIAYGVYGWQQVPVIKLAQNQVDLIASYWKDSDQLQFSANYITAIEHQVQGGVWYMKLMQQNYDLYCALQTSLLNLSQRMGGYYQQAQAAQLSQPALQCPTQLIAEGAPQ